MPRIARANLGLLAGLTLILAFMTAGKVAALQNSLEADQASTAIESAAVEAWLADNRFAIQTSASNGFAVVHGRRSRCRLTIAVVDGRGFHRHLMRTMATPGERTYFVFKGGIYAEQPLLKTAVSHHLWARARDVGIRLPRELVLGVVSSNCPQSLPWQHVKAIL